MPAPLLPHAPQHSSNKVFILTSTGQLVSGVTRVGTGTQVVGGRLAELGTVGDRCHHLLQRRCPQMGAGDREGSGVVAWEGLKLSWPEPKPRSCRSGAGRGPVRGNPCGATLGGGFPTGKGVSCARKWAEADRGCGFPHRWWQSLWSQMSGSAVVNVTGDRAPHGAGGLGGVLGARAGPTAPCPWYGESQAEPARSQGGR